MKSLGYNYLKTYRQETPPQTSTNALTRGEVNATLRWHVSIGMGHKLSPVLPIVEPEDGKEVDKAGSDGRTDKNEVELHLPGAFIVGFFLYLLIISKILLSIDNRHAYHLSFHHH